MSYYERLKWVIVLLKFMYIDNIRICHNFSKKHLHIIMEIQTNPNVITGREGAEIDLNVAAEWTKNRRKRKPKDYTISQFFGYEILQRILNQPGCMGIRIYYANSSPLNGWQRFITAIANFLLYTVAGSEGDVHLILTGVNKDGTDQLPPPGKNVDLKTFRNYTPADAAAQDNTLGEQSHPCPGSAGCPTNVLTGR